MNLVQLIADPEEQYPAPCIHGDIVARHACYCNLDQDGAPRKCPIWRNREEWSIYNCEYFERNEDVSLDTY